MKIKTFKDLQVGDSIFVLSMVYSGIDVLQVVIDSIEGTRFHTHWKGTSFTYRINFIAGI